MCCGNTICFACYKENEASINKQNEEKTAGKKVAFTCPFCREPDPTDMEYLRKLQARCLENDHEAFTVMGSFYRGDRGAIVPKDDLKALDCFIRAVELGSPHACICIADACNEGKGVAVDKERAILFERVGALRGDVAARHNIGVSELKLGNYEFAIRHWKIAAEAGLQSSLDELTISYNMPGKDFITKEYLDFAYRACHEAQMEVESEERKKHFGTK